MQQKNSMEQVQTKFLLSFFNVHRLISVSSLDPKYLQLCEFSKGN